MPRARSKFRPSRFPYKVPGVSVYKRGDAGPRASWLAAYTIPGRPRVQNEPLSADAQVAYAKALELSRVVMGAKADPGKARLAQMEQRPLDGTEAEPGHLQDYQRFLVADGDTAAHAAQVVSRARRILKACGFVRVSDISPGLVKEAIADLKDLRPSGRNRRRKSEPGKVGAKVVPAGHQTKNHYLRAIKQFTAWLSGPERRADRDPLKHLEGLNVKLDRRHDRQDLGEDGVARLIAAAKAGPVVKDMTGPDRAWLYETAYETGFRANELRTLTPRRCQLEGARPVLVVKAGYSKHRREDVQPIRVEFARRLARYIAGRDLDAPIWNICDHPIDLLRNDRTGEGDLQRAGIAYQDEDGRFADFHALRHSFVCRLVRAGLLPKECQVLARHSSIQQTMDYYAHLKIHDLTRAVNSLPGLPEAQQALATGTDGSAVAQTAARGRRWASPGVAGSRNAGREADVKSLGTAGETAFSAEEAECTREGSNLQPSVPKTPPQNRASLDLSAVTRAGRLARSANRSAPDLHAAIEKVTALFASGRKGGLA